LTPSSQHHIEHHARNAQEPVIREEDLISARIRESLAYAMELLVLHDKDFTRAVFGNLLWGTRQNVVLYRLSELTSECQIETGCSSGVK
jgi:hypothetical protein